MRVYPVIIIISIVFSIIGMVGWVGFYYQPALLLCLLASVFGSVVSVFALVAITREGKE